MSQPMEVEWESPYDENVEVAHFDDPLDVRLILRGGLASELCNLS